MLKHKEDDIRRRLTIAEVPKPPADLVQKIKHDIPKHFTSMTAKEVEKNKQAKDPTPLWNIWGFSWQLAASILVLVGLTWAVFEAYRTEINEAAKVADTGKGPMSVDEFESRVTTEPDVLRVEGSAPAADAGKAVGEMKQETAQAAPSITVPPPMAASEPYAPEPAAPKRTTIDYRADAEETGARAKEAMTEETVTRPQAQVARSAPAGTELADAPAAGAPERNEADLARKAAAPAAPAAAELSEDSVASLFEKSPRVVFVKGLDFERIVKVNVEINADGRVLKTSVPDVKDLVIIDAVSAAARNWSFALDKDDAGRKDQKQTIDVQLRKSN